MIKFYRKFKPIFYLTRLYQSKMITKSNVFSVIFFILSIIFSIFAGVVFSNIFSLNQSSISSLFNTILAFQLVMGAGSLINLLINESEYESLLVLPIPSGMIAIVKVIGILLSIYKYSFLFYITLTIGLCFKLNLYYGIVIGMFSFLYSILSLFVFTGILLLLPKYLSIFRNKKIFNILASIIPALFYILFNFGRNTVLIPVLKFLSYLPLNYLFSYTILTNNFLTVVVSLTISLLIIYLFYRYIDHFLAYILLSQKSEIKKSATKFSYFKYELRLLFNNPGYISEIIFPSLFLNIMIGIQFFTLKIGLNNFGISTALGMLIAVIAMNLSYLNVTALSREAAQMDSILCLPISGKQLFKIKFIPNYIISMIITLPLIGIILYLNFNINAIGFIIGLLLNSFVTSGFLIIQGFKRTCFNFSTIKQLTKETYSIIQFLYSILAGTGGAMIYLIPQAEYVVFIYFIISCIYFYTQHKKINQIYQEIYLS